MRAIEMQMDNIGMRVSEGAAYQLRSSGVLAKVIPSDDLRAWSLVTLPTLAFEPADIIAASSASLDEAASEDSGVYFLVWQGMLVYVGVATSLWDRLACHQREGRPHDAVAAIVGLPRNMASAVEHAYASAWRFPWNGAPTHGSWPGSDVLTNRLAAMNRSLVMPLYVAHGGRALSFMKPWQLQVLGREQAKR